MLTLFLFVYVLYSLSVKFWFLIGRKRKAEGDEGRRREEEERGGLEGSGRLRKEEDEEDLEGGRLKWRGREERM